MPVIQHRPNAALLAFVLAYDARLDRHAPPDRLRRRLSVQLQDAIRVLLEERQQLIVRDERVLDDLCPPREVLARRQSSEGRRVRQDQPGLVEGADHVLRPWVVYADFP